MMFNSTLKHTKPQFFHWKNRGTVEGRLGHPSLHQSIHRHVYTVALFTLCYGWRVGIVKYIVIVTATAAPTSDLKLLQTIYIILP